MSAAQRPRFWFPALVTLALAVILIGETVGFSLYTYADVKEEIEPKKLADTTERIIRERYPEMRAKVVAEIKDNAPQIAEIASKKAIEASPEARQWLERVTARQLEYGLDEATELSAEQFRVVLREHHDEVEEAFVEVEKAPEKARRLVHNLEDSLDKQYGIDLQKDAKRVLEIQRRLNDKLERLNSNAPLEPKELLERRIVRILRTLEQEQLKELGLAQDASQ